MTTPSPEQAAKQKYEEKRKSKGDPRFGGYLTKDEKKIFTETKKLGGFKSEKEMVIEAVQQLHKKLSC
ncbi:hypothetical protein ABMY12_20845 [Vibrio vulnificus]|uniref:hypothetical protein n=1 Tax=Vibrio vulnificus TaxID=672 RepID=UPI00405830B7